MENQNYEFIFIVYEDNHGDVSWWDDKDAAYNEAFDIIMENPFSEKYNKETGEWDRTEIKREDLTHEDVDSYRFCVGIRKVPKNVSWV